MVRVLDACVNLIFIPGPSYTCAHYMFMLHACAHVQHNVAHGPLSSVYRALVVVGAVMVCNMFLGFYVLALAFMSYSIYIDMDTHAQHSWWGIFAMS